MRSSKKSQPWLDLMVNEMNENEINTEQTECDIIDCTEPSDGYNCGDYGNNCCSDCHHSYINGEWELDFEQKYPNAGRDNA